MIFFITLFFGLIYLYVTFRCLNFMASPHWIKISLLILLLPGVINIMAVLAWGAKMPQMVINLFAGAGLALIYLGVGTLLIDFLRWIHKPIPCLADVIVIISLVLSAYAIYWAQKLPIIHEIRIHSNELPQDWQPLKIVHLSDLHIGQGFTKERLKKIVQRTNALNPDVIFSTGDSIDLPVAKLGKDMEILNSMM